MLDAWRGLASVAVVVAHLGFPLSFNMGHVAVLVFFVISGYCIAAAAQSAIRRGMGFREFMFRRLRRIYPPYFFALVFFVLTRIVKGLLGRGWQLPSSPLVWLQNFTLTQWMSLPFYPDTWAYGSPSLMVGAYWSLNFEEQFYLVMGLLIAGALAMRWTSLLPAILLLLGAGLAWNVVAPEMSYGFFIEYWLHFALGCVVYYRLCAIRSRWYRTAIDAALVLLVVVSFRLTWYGSYQWNTATRLTYYEWFVVASFAVLLIATRRWSRGFASLLVGQWLMKLGLITYSLYLIHQFNETIAHEVGRRLTPASWTPLARLPVELAYLILLATAFWYFFERPFLNKRPAETAKAS